MLQLRHGNEGADSKSHCDHTPHSQPNLFGWARAYTAGALHILPAYSSECLQGQCAGTLPILLQYFMPSVLLSV